MDDIISRKRTLADLREIQETLACGGDPILAALMNTPIKKVKEQNKAGPNPGSQTAGSPHLGLYR